MRKRAMMLLAVAGVVAATLASTQAAGSAQTPSVSTHKVPRTPAGQPDLQGIWQA